MDVTTFLTVADCGSISKAAKQLGHTKSMVSQRVARLERALGTELLTRSSRGVQLTDSGALYLAQASEGLALLESAAESVATESRGATGLLRVSAPVTFSTHFLGEVLCDFLHEYPDMQMQLEVHDHQIDLTAEGFDLGIRITRHPGSSSEHLSLLGLSRRVVCCSPEYASLHGVPRRKSELPQHSAIGYSNQLTSHLWSFRETKRTERFTPAPGRLQTNNGEIMRDAARDGLGIVVLPLFIVAHDLRMGRLVQIRTEEEPQPDQIFTVCPPRKARLLRVRLLVDHLKKALAGTPMWEKDLPAPF